MTGHIFVDDRNKDFERKLNATGTYGNSSIGNELYNSGPTVSGRTRNKKRTLKLTEYRKTWVHNQVRKYAEQIGITEQDMPSVVFTSKEVLAMPNQLTEGRRTVTYKYLGICFRGAKTISNEC
jgi:hypothetical protein